MDIVSHALWSGVVLGRKNKKRFIGVVIFSVLPDIFGEGIMFLFMFLGLDGMPSLENGHPNIADYPIYAQNFYNSSHSLVVFALAFLLIYMLNKKVYWPMLGWGLHILIDIPTHSIELFPTPFL